MKKLACFIVDQRYKILFIVLALAAVCALLIPRVEIITDMTRYLPDDSPMKTGLEIISIDDVLRDSFSAIGFSNEKSVCLIGRAAGEFTRSTSAEEEIWAGWYTREEVRALLQREDFSARSQAYCYMWSKSQR